MKESVNTSSDPADSYENDEIPEGWESKKLKEIFAWSNGKSLPKKNIDQGEFPVFGGNGINGYHSKYLIEKDCLVIGRVGADCGNVHLAPKKSWVTDNAIYTSGYPESTDLKFYYLLLKNLKLNSLSGGSGQPFISQTVLDEICVAVPSLSEQQRIVARVEALLTHINAARVRLSRVPLIMKKFRQAVLAAACSGKLTEGWRESNAVVGIEQSLQKDDVDFNDETNTPFYIGLIPDTWCWISIEDAMEKVIDYRGRTPPIEKKGIPHITTSNIRNGHINWITEKFVTQETYDNYMTRGIPEIGDVFFTMEGPLGEVAILHENRKFSLAQRMLLLRGQKEIFDSEYLAFALMCSGVQSAINMKATGSSVKGIAYKRFKHVKIPLPPLAEQHEIFRRVGLLFERADAFDREVVATSRRCERLTQAVLGKAFRGELTSTIKE